MIPYIVLVFLPGIYAFILKLSSRREDSVGSRSISLFFFLWLLILALRRNDIGIDLDNYRYLFTEASHISLKSALSYWKDFESGYIVFNSILSHLTHNFQWLLVLSGLITLIPMWLFYSKRTEQPFFVIALFMGLTSFPLYFSALRQVMAMAFVFPAFEFAIKRRIAPFLAMVLLAVLFHSSSIIMILIYPLCNIRLKKDSLWWIVGISLLIFLLSKFVFNVFLVFLNEKYVELYGQVDNNGAYRMLVLYLILICYSFIVADEKKMTKDQIAMRNLSALVVFIQPIASVSHVAMRFNYFFLPFMPLLISYVTKYPQPRYRIITYVARIAMTLFFLYYYFKSVYSGTVFDTDLLQIYPWIPYWSHI